MIPTIFTFGPLPINSFGLLVALAMFAAIIRAGESFKNNGLPREKGEQYAFIGTVVGLLGARLWFIAEHFSSLHADLFSALFSSAGFTFYGGFLLSFVVIVLLSRKDNIPFSRLADSVGPPLTMCYMVGRLGCQLSGDGDYGIPTESFWGMAYDTGVVATPAGQRVYPTPLFESALSALILIFLVHIETKPRWQVPFRRASAYFVLISFERFLVEFLRVNPRHELFAGVVVSDAQVVALGFMLFGLVIGALSLKTYSSSVSSSSSSSTSSKSSSSSSSTS